MTHEFHPWEIWNGGECPCPGEMVQVHYRENTRADAERMMPFECADSYTWRNGDIIAFRRVKKPQTVTFGVDCEDGRWRVTRAVYSTDTHRLIFEVVNGEPVNPRFERIE